MGVMSQNKLLVVQYFDGLVQNCSNSITNAQELLQSCTNPSSCPSEYIFGHNISNVFHPITHFCKVEAEIYCSS